jgi:hypothetical protein
MMGTIAIAESLTPGGSCTSPLKTLDTTVDKLDTGGMNFMRSMKNKITYAANIITSGTTMENTTTSAIAGTRMTTTRIETATAIIVAMSIER